MDNATLPSSPDYPALTSDIVPAYVSHNSVPRADLIALIASVHAALTGVSKSSKPEEPLTPPVPINKPSARTTSSASRTGGSTGR